MSASRKRNPAKLTKVKLSLPFGIGEAEWEEDPTQRRAAWALYVELVTRISVEPLAGDEGSLREALGSLYSLFGSTRGILRDAGPDVGVRLDTVGGIAIAVLNRGLRPFLVHWHPRLEEWEAQRPQGIGPREHERSWAEASVLRKQLSALRRELEQYASALGVLAGAEDS